MGKYSSASMGKYSSASVKPKAKDRQAALSHPESEGPAPSTVRSVRSRTRQQIEKRLNKLTKYGDQFVLVCAEQPEFPVRASADCELNPGSLY